MYKKGKAIRILGRMYRVLLCTRACGWLGFFPWTTTLPLLARALHILLNSMNDTCQTRIILHIFGDWEEIGGERALLVSSDCPENVHHSYRVELFKDSNTKSNEQFGKS